VLTRHFGDLSRLAAVVLPANCPAVVLLGAYLRGLPLGRDAPDAAARDMIGRQVVDLLVSAIGHCVGVDDRGQGFGARAARVAMIKRLIEQQIAQPNLNAARIGRHFGVTERYVQKLLEEAGTTFSGYVMERRLSIARMRLGDPAFAGMSVRDVAFSAGFSDPAHFARSFRRRFGETPTSVRSSHACGDGLKATG
jgi:AraC-like DNA-binding protein